MSTNDNDTSATGAPAPDAHGHAALLLVESLVHGLIARSIITTEEAVEIVESAESVQADLTEAADPDSRAMWQSHALLTAITASLRIDLNRDRDHD